MHKGLTFLLWKFQRIGGYFVTWGKGQTNPSLKHTFISIVHGILIDLSRVTEWPLARALESAVGVRAHSPSQALWSWASFSCPHLSLFLFLVVSVWSFQSPAVRVESDDFREIQNTA